MDSLLLRVDRPFFFSFMSAQIPFAAEVQIDERSFVHFKEPRNYTRFRCAAYKTPPALTGVLGDVFLTGEDSTAWVRGHQGWALADKTLDDKGVPKQVHPDYLGYIRLDPTDSEWKSTWDFRPKPAQRKRKQRTSGSPQEEKASGSEYMLYFCESLKCDFSTAGGAMDNTSIMELFVAMKDCQERTVAELVAVKEDHARTKAELDTVKEQHTRTKAELDALKEDHMGTKAELEHAKSKIQQAEKEVHNLKAERTLSNANLTHASVELGQSRASLRLADKEIQGLKASLASSSSRLMPVDTNGNISGLQEIMSRLQVLEATIQEMKAELASTSANLDALIGSKVPREMQVMNVVIAAGVDEAEAPVFAGRPILRRLEMSNPRNVG